MGSTEPDEVKVVTVSRDALRADLLQTELRLREYLDAKLAFKAEASHVNALEKQYAELAQGILPAGLSLKVESLIEAAMQARVSRHWFLRSNRAGVLVATCALLSLSVGIAAIVASHWH